MISSSKSASIIETLLNHCPLGICGHNKTVKVNLKPVGDRVVVDARCQPAGANELIAVKPATIGDRSQFLRSVSREFSSTTTDVNAKVVCTRRETSLESSHHRCGNSGGMPIHSHHRTERLEPERIAQPAEKCRCAVVADYGLGDR